MTIAKICPAPHHTNPHGQFYVIRPVDEEGDEYLHDDGQWRCRCTAESSTGYFPNRAAAETALENALKTGAPANTHENIEAETITARAHKAAGE